ncbi:hypothetical protein GCM10007967_04350 [Xylanimonas ulmi]
MVAGLTPAVPTLTDTASATTVRATPASRTTEAGTRRRVARRLGSSGLRSASGVGAGWVVRVEVMGLFQARACGQHKAALDERMCGSVRCGGRARVAGQRRRRRTLTSEGQHMGAPDMPGAAMVTTRVLDMGAL